MKILREETIDFLRVNRHQLRIEIGGEGGREACKRDKRGSSETTRTSSEIRGGACWSEEESCGWHESTVYSGLRDVLATFDRNVCRKFSASPGLAGEFESTKFLRPDTAEKTGGGELRSRSTTKFHLSLSDNLFFFFTRKFFTPPLFFFYKFFKLVRQRSKSFEACKITLSIDILNLYIFLQDFVQGFILTIDYTPRD